VVKELQVLLLPHSQINMALPSTRCHSHLPHLVFRDLLLPHHNNLSKEVDILKDRQALMATLSLHHPLHLPAQTRTES
jgi:hypothetical protein